MKEAREELMKEEMNGERGGEMKKKEEEEGKKRIAKMRNNARFT